MCYSSLGSQISLSKQADLNHAETFRSGQRKIGLHSFYQLSGEQETGIRQELLLILGKIPPNAARRKDFGTSKAWLEAILSNCLHVMWISNEIYLGLIS